MFFLMTVINHECTRISTNKKGARNWAGSERIGLLLCQLALQHL